MNHQNGNITEFLKQIRTVCFISNDGGLSFDPYKQVISSKSMNNSSNNKPHDPNGFKEEIKIKSMPQRQRSKNSQTEQKK